ncbi:MAG TPA: hypothetical protein VHK91_08235 [Flavisolibacter sp.]|jgi:hypothetical protein|nr:hypothetical protein [Flavisolibacter sp.]
MARLKFHLKMAGIVLLFLIYAVLKMNEAITTLLKSKPDWESTMKVTLIKTTKLLMHLD